MPISSRKLRALGVEVVSGIRERARRSDIMLVAAALTAYAAFGLLPLLAIGLRVASWVLGEADVVQAARGVAQFVPGPLHLDRGIIAFAQSAATAPWWTVLVALVPASLYAEGTVRSLERFSRVPERRSRALRGRLLTLVMVAGVVVAVLLLVGPLRPLLFDPFGQGLGARLLGILVSFNLMFFACAAVLALLYRLFASTPIRLTAVLIAAGAAASWLASQTLAYLLAVRLISGFARAYGGFAPAGAVAAMLFLVYLEHLVFLLGYALALRLHEQPLSSLADRGRDDLRRERDQRQATAGMRRTSDQEQAPDG